jgi:uncharacterized protein (TIGR03435 family)
MRLSISLLLVTSALGQQRPSFEVATIKPNTEGSQSFSLNFAPDGRFTARNLSVWNVIRTAYDLRDLQIVGAPAWIKTQGFDIQAQPAAGSPAPREQVTLMIQSLLADRFHLKYHREIQQQPGYALVVGSRGAKLAPARQGPSKTLMGDFDIASMNLKSFASVLEYDLDRPVANQTGIDGNYALKIEWASDRIPADATSGKPSLFTALQEQLGLKLESARVPVEMFVIDSIDQPTEN